MNKRINLCIYIAGKTSSYQENIENTPSLISNHECKELRKMVAMYNVKAGNKKA